jgi:hypothetical protein
MRSAPPGVCHPRAVTVLAQDGGLGEGRIDNWIVDSSVHVVVGVLVLVSMTAAVAWTGRLALAGRPLDLTGRIVLTTAQAVLAVQVLLGIKLLDQGQGISQLYIHYIGGLLPLGIFLAGGWWIRTTTGRGTRILALLLGAGWMSALMAFFIGRAYVNR